MGTYRGMSWTGAYDTAGNVKEWCLNEATPGKRYILGAARNEPTYMFNDDRCPVALRSLCDFRLSLREVFDHRCICQGGRPGLD